MSVSDCVFVSDGDGSDNLRRASVILHEGFQFDTRG
jgi:hypothetical protein